MALSPKYMGRPAAEETINDPNNPRHYWRYRIHYTLEDVLEDEPLISDLQALLLGGCLAGSFTMSGSVSAGHVVGMATAYDGMCNTAGSGRCSEAELPELHTQ